MKKIIFFLILFPAIFCNGCKKEDLTDTIDITQFSWKLKSITIDGNKSKTPNKDYHGDKIDKDNVYKLRFVNDSLFQFDLSINEGQGKYDILQSGKILFPTYGTTYVCCNSDFEQDLLPIISKIKSYQVLDNILLLKGDNCEIELKQE